MSIDWAQHLLFDELLLQGFEGAQVGVRLKKTKERSWLCSPEMFGAIPGAPWEAGWRWCAVSAAPDRWLLWCGQTWWVWPDMGQFLSDCNLKRKEKPSKTKKNMRSSKENGLLQTLRRRLTSSALHMKYGNNMRALHITDARLMSTISSTWGYFVLPICCDF